MSGPMADRLHFSENFVPLSRKKEHFDLCLKILFIRYRCIFTYSLEQ